MPPTFALATRRWSKRPGRPGPGWVASPMRTPRSGSGRFGRQAGRDAGARTAPSRQSAPRPQAGRCHRWGASATGPAHPVQPSQVHVVIRSCVHRERGGCREARAVRRQRRGKGVGHQVVAHPLGGLSVLQLGGGGACRLEGALAQRALSWALHPRRWRPCALSRRRLGRSGAAQQCGRLAVLSGRSTRGREGALAQWALPLVLHPRRGGGGPAPGCVGGRAAAACAAWRSAALRCQRRLRLRNTGAPAASTSDRAPRARLRRHRRALQVGARREARIGPRGCVAARRGTRTGARQSPQ
jgi:hypothetical protein